MGVDDYAYLRDGFNPNALRKDELRNVLLTHDVAYEDSMLKGDLVALFEEHIVPRRAQLRARFLGAAPSSSNIELSTPPRPLPVPRTRGRARSPQPAPRELSPGRASPRRVSSKGKREQTPELGAIPDLKLERGEDEAPKSPRRRRGTRRVLVDAEEHATPAPASEIKLSAPRTSRKRVHDESEAETSFSTLNVFQKKEKRVKHEEKPAPPSEKPRMRRVKDSKHEVKQEAPQEPEPEQTRPQRHPREQRGRPKREPASDPEIPAAFIDVHMDDGTTEADEVAAVLEAASEIPESAQIMDIQFSHDGVLTDVSISAASVEPETGGETGGESDASELAAANAFDDASDDVSQDAGEAPLRAPVPRGLLPTLAQLRSFRAPAEFAERLEPYMVPTPSPSLSRIDSPVRIERVEADDADADATPTRPRAAVTRIAEVASAAADAVADEAVAVVEEAEDAARKSGHAAAVAGVAVARGFRAALPGAARFAARVLDASVLVFFLTSTLTVIILGGLTAQWYSAARSAQDFCGVYTPGTAPFAYPSWAEGSDNIYVAQAQQAARGLLDAIRPGCVPCPAHALCLPNRLFVCEPGYTRRERAWPYLAPCIVDTEQVRKKDVFEARAAETLRQANADALCSHAAPEVPAHDLRAQLHAQKSDKLSEDEFETLWQRALADLPTSYPDVQVYTRELTRASLQQLRQMLTFQNSGADEAHARDAAAATLGERDGEQERKYAVLMLRSTSRSHVTLACAVSAAAVAALRAHGRELLVATGVALLVAALAMLAARSRRRRRRVARAVDLIVAALQQQRAAAERDGGVPYLRSVSLRQQYARKLWPEVARRLAAVDGLRQNQREVHGDICETWEWTL